MVTPYATTEPLGERLALAAKDDWPIPNIRPLRELSPVEVHSWVLAQGGAGRQIVDLTFKYNCMGLVFGNRRTRIDVAHLREILARDHYQLVNGRPAVGDIVVYRRDGFDRHVGLVWRVEQGVGFRVESIRIRSKWGDYADVLHDLDDVLPQWAGQPEFWTDRLN